MRWIGPGRTRSGGGGACLGAVSSACISARLGAGRLNLGEGSNLFFKLVEVIEINQLTIEDKPLKLDPADCTPMSRPHTVF